MRENRDLVGVFLEDLHQKIKESTLKKTSEKLQKEIKSSLEDIFSKFPNLRGMVKEVVTEQLKKNTISATGGQVMSEDSDVHDSVGSILLNKDLWKNKNSVDSYFNDAVSIRGGISKS